MISVEREVARDLVERHLGSGPDAEHRDGPGLEMRAPGVRDERRREARALRGRLELEQLALAFALHDDLALPRVVPALEGVRLVALRLERAVDGGMPDLRGELARGELEVLAGHDDELVLVHQKSSGGRPGAARSRLAATAKTAMARTRRATYSQPASALTEPGAGRRYM